MEGGDSSAVASAPPRARRGSGGAIYEKYLNIKDNALSNEDGAVKKPMEISNSTGKKKHVNSCHVEYFFRKKDYIY